MAVTPQGLDPSDPIPDDPRLTLPLAVAGFILYRALHASSQGADLVMDVYDEIAHGIAIVRRCLGYVAHRKITGEFPEQFLADFAHGAMVAEALMLHAVRLGPEAWALILRCGLGDRCRLEEPFYVTHPGRPKPHGACRTAKARGKAGRVTLKLVSRNKLAR